MILKQGEPYLSEWFENNNGEITRDFIFRDYGNWVWHVKQYADPADKTTVIKNIAYQSNPMTGVTEQRGIELICNKAMNEPLMRSLQFTHKCICCN